MSDSSSGGGCFGCLLELIGLFFLLVFIKGCQEAPDGKGLEGGTKNVVQTVKGLWETQEAQ